VKGIFFKVQKSLSLLNDGASIILTASIADIKGFPAISVYSATKAAVRSFARTWTNELRERRIRVNAISPGHIDTPIFEGWQQGEELAKTFRLAGWEIRTKSPKPLHFSHPMRRVTSLGLNCSSMAESPKSDGTQRKEATS
jgi:NAD(P)-dependent dehydrogenase (short-subunit alcohol dehydrogenase family)